MLEDIKNHRLSKKIYGVISNCVAASSHWKVLLYNPVFVDQHYVIYLSDLK